VLEVPVRRAPDLAGGRSALLEGSDLDDACGGHRPDDEAIDGYWVNDDDVGVPAEGKNSIATVST